MRRLMIMGAAAAVLLVGVTAPSTTARDRGCSRVETWPGDIACYNAPDRPKAMVVTLHIQKAGGGREKARAVGMTEEGGAIWVEAKKGKGKPKRVAVNRIAIGSTGHPVAGSRHQSRGWYVRQKGEKVRACIEAKAGRFRTCTGWH
ncbi:hypothetical protein ABZ135_36860 [Streptomyces sp. NPDC006339]|uniref:hypothetical protein n=1 Tax=Streptomyces sp. NPDC006339 TaxID=3156755 RepID=UPI0033AF4027